MTLRKALVASPLAVLVAVLAHVAAFGFSHTPGAERSGVLIGALALALAASVVAAFAAGFFDLDFQGPATRRAGLSPLLLAGFGVATFGLIEWSEGHAVFAALAEATCAAVPLAYVVACLALVVGSIARTAGARSGAFFHRVTPGPRRAIALATRRRSTDARASLVAQRAFRGRGPPLFI